MAIELINLKKYYAMRGGSVFAWKKRLLRALDGITLTVRDRETVSLVGESGCGKTTIARLALRLERPTSGTIRFDGKDLQSFTKADITQYCRSLQSVFQNPYASLNPRMQIGDTIAEPLIANRLMSRHDARERVNDLLKQVGLPRESASLYPHEFSGGQRQRIAVARALSLNPQYIILDEPVSALDVSISAQVMNLLKALQDELGIGYLLITHDLAMAIHLSHRVEIIYAGKVVESVSAGKLYHQALHPYTKALLKAASPVRMREGGKDLVLPGEVPDPLNKPPGCHFHPRCPDKVHACASQGPSVVVIDQDHSVCCHLYS